MATVNDTTGAGGGIVPSPADVVAQTTTIQASTFTSMLNVLSSLTTHTHTFYDDYTTVCQCQCQCESQRGLL
jgi:hypothetical protein